MVVFTHLREEQEQREAYQQLRETIDQNYRSLHKHLYQLSGWEFVSSFREAMESGDESKMRSLLTEETSGAFWGTVPRT